MDIRVAERRYLQQLEADGRSIHTRKQIARHVRALARWFAPATDLASLREEHLASFLNSEEARTRPDGRPKLPSSMNQLRSSLRRFFAWLHRARLLEENPSHLVRRARTAPPPPRGLSDVEEERLRSLLSHAPVRDRTLILTLLDTGIRVGSAVDLDVEDLDLDEGLMRLRGTKGGGEDLLPLASAALERLRAFVGDRRAGPLFMGAGGGRLSLRHVQRLYASYARGAGLRSTRIHATRHAFAMRLYAKTGDLAVVQRALGHRSIVSTLRYAQADTARLRRHLG